MAYINYSPEEALQNIGMQQRYSMGDLGILNRFNKYVAENRMRQALSRDLAERKKAIADKRFEQSMAYKKMTSDLQHDTFLQKLAAQEGAQSKATGLAKLSLIPSGVQGVLNFLTERKEAGRQKEIEDYYREARALNALKRKEYEKWL